MPPKAKVSKNAAAYKKKKEGGAGVEANYTSDMKVIDNILEYNMNNVDTRQRSITSFERIDTKNIYAIIVKRRDSEKRAVFKINTDLIDYLLTRFKGNYIPNTTIVKDTDDNYSYVVYPISDLDNGLTGILISSSKAYYAIIVFNNEARKIIRAYEIIKPNTAVQAVMQAVRSVLKSAKQVIEVDFYFDLKVTPAQSSAPTLSLKEFELPPRPYEDEDEEDDGVYKFEYPNEPDKKPKWQKPDLPKKPEEDVQHPFGVPSQEGGKKKIEAKKTNAKYTYNKREYTLYEGARGGKYIRLNKEFVSIKKLKAKAQAH